MTADKKNQLILFHLEALYQYNLGNLDKGNLNTLYGLLLRDAKEIENGQ